MAAEQTSAGLGSLVKPAVGMAQKAVKADKVKSVKLKLKVKVKKSGD